MSLPSFIRRVLVSGTVRLWKWLESRPNHTAVMDKWQQISGESISVVQRFLQPFETPATAYPTSRRRGFPLNNACQRDGDILARDETDDQTGSSLLDGGVVQYRLCLNKLRKSICSALSRVCVCQESIDQNACSIQIGNWEPKKSILIPVHLLMCTSTDELKVEVYEQIIFRKRPGAILLTPTRMHWREKIIDAVRLYNTLLVPLCEVVEADGDTLRQTPVWEEYLDGFVLMDIPGVPQKPIDRLPENIFRRNGGGWQVRFCKQEPFTILPWLGASYIHVLLSSPCESMPAIDIVSKAAIDCCDHAVRTHDAIDAGLESATNPLLETLGHISDWEAIKAYRRQATELLADMERARRDHDNVTELQIENDLAMITGLINEAIGIGGRLKQAGNKRKNISDGFRNNVKRVINRQIRETDPALAQHLDESILFGYTPRYIPKPGLTWDIDPVRNE